MNQTAVQVIPIPALRDNYIWLMPVPLARPERAIIVDPGESEPVLDALGQLGLAPSAILLTHHHSDHTGGVSDLLRHRRVPVHGPLGAHPDVDHPVTDGMVISLEGLTIEVMAVPGHTLDHLAYTVGDVLFCGDTLFAAGCGRLFEGTARQMHASLTKLAALPDATRVCCAHEYTEANLAFALAVEPGSAAIASRLAAVQRLRSAGEPSLPSTLAEERLTNPFLRCEVPAVIEAARRNGARSGDPVDIFAAIRAWKDRF